LNYGARATLGISYLLNATLEIVSVNVIHVSAHNWATLQ